MAEFYKKHRPATFQDVVGQAGACRMLTGMVEDKSVPRAILFSGPSGCGKTTFARILRNEIGCSESDYIELNCADVRGIDTIRDIKQRMTLAPMGGRCRVYCLDECHQLTKDAQNALLKMLEDTPKTVYFFLCSTDPGKLIATIKTRCTEISLKAVDDEKMRALILRVAERETMEVDRDIVDRIIDVAEGSPRKALVLLSSIHGIAASEDQLEIIESGDHKTDAIQLARALMQPQMKWAAMAGILSGMKDQDPEGLRRMVLGYCQAILLKGDANPRAAAILEGFSRPFYDTLWPGLTLAVFNLVRAENRK